MALARPDPRRRTRLGDAPLARDLLGLARDLSPLGRWVAIACAAFLLLVVLAAVLAPWLSPYPAQGAGQSDMLSLLQPPSPAHLLGTDDEGRDILSRLLYGARPSLVAAFVVVATAIVLGSLVGAAAGYLGGAVEQVLMRVTDFFLAFPSLLLAIVIATIIGPSLQNVIVSLAVTWWPWYARLVHAQAGTLRQAAFVRSARLSGVRGLTMLVRHIIPNALTPVVVQGTSDLGSVIISAAGLSYLGLGTQPPQADWGSMVSQGQQYILAQWWYVTFPGLAILLTAMAFNLLGDAFRDLTDPSVRRT
jgi:peptide/nickel transport system permease protein